MQWKLVRPFIFKGSITGRWWFVKTTGDAYDFDSWQNCIDFLYGNYSPNSNA